MKSASLLPIVAGVFLLILGLIFIVASGDANTATRLVAGIAMLVLGAWLLRLGTVRRRSQPVVVSQKIDLSGDVDIQELQCSKCGGHLSSENLSVKAGAIFVSCPFCSSEYQIEEEPKW